MKKAGNKNLKLIAFTGMTIFSLFSVFMGTIAWFAMNRVVNSNGAQFVVQPIPSMIKSISVFNQSEESSPYVFNSTPVVTYEVTMTGANVTSGNAENISLGHYESLSDTPDSTLLYLFELDDELVGTEHDGCSLHIKTDTRDSAAAGANGTNGSLLHRNNEGTVSHKVTYDVSEDNKTNMQKEDKDLTDEYFGKNSMSSIMVWDYLTFAQAPAITDNTYDLRSQFDGENKTATSSSFISTKERTFSLNGLEHTETVFYYSTYDIDLFTREKDSLDDVPMYIAVVCHYHVQALQYIFNINLGNPATETNASVGWDYIKFTCDWYFQIN